MSQERYEPQEIVIRANSDDITLKVQITSLSMTHRSYRARREPSALSLSRARSKFAQNGQPLDNQRCSSLSARRDIARSNLIGRQSRANLPRVDLAPADDDRELPRAANRRHTRRGGRAEEKVLSCRRRAA